MFADLRFVIGLFFLLIGLILVATGFFTPELTPSGHNLNLMTGLMMLAFSVFMLNLSVRAKRRVDRLIH